MSINVLELTKSEFVKRYKEANSFLFPKSVVIEQLKLTDKQRELENSNVQLPIINVAEFLLKELKNGKSIEKFDEIEDSAILVHDGEIHTESSGGRGANDIAISLFKDIINSEYYAVISINLDEKGYSNDFIMKYDCDDEQEMLEDLNRKVPVMMFNNIDGYLIIVEASIMNDRLYIHVEKNGKWVADYDGYINVIGDEQDIINEIKDKIINDIEE